MSKRAATTELNHNNWDKEDEPEEGFGVFQRAKDDVLKSRVIKTAKRHGTKLSDGMGLKASPFSGFTGFINSDSSATSSPFSFLNTNKKPLTTENINKIEDDNKGKFSKETEPQVKMLNNSFIFSPFQNKDNNGTILLNVATDQNIMLPDNTSKSFGNFLNKGNVGKETDKKSQNLEILKDLNLSCNSWITEHLEKNPYCILTPIFKDYEKHLAQLELEMESEKKGNNFEIPQFKSKPTSESLNQPSDQKNTETASVEEKDKVFNFEGNVGSSILNKSTESILPMTVKNNFSFGGLFQPMPGPGINLNVGGNQKNDGDVDDESSEPPKSDFTPIIEENSMYDKRCKVFVKKGSNFVPKGVGTLFLKPIKDSKHTQLIVRADTSSGNILLNVLLTSSLPIQKTGKNNIMIVCRPLPTEDASSPPVPILIRVKTGDDCDEVIKKLEECKDSLSVPI